MDRNSCLGACYSRESVTNSVYCVCAHISEGPPFAEVLHTSGTAVNQRRGRIHTLHTCSFHSRLPESTFLAFRRQKYLPLWGVRC